MEIEMSPMYRFVSLTASGHYCCREIVGVIPFDEDNSSPLVALEWAMRQLSQRPGLRMNALNVTMEGSSADATLVLFQDMEVEEGTIAHLVAYDEKGKETLRKRFDGWNPEECGYGFGRPSYQGGVRMLDNQELVGVTVIHTWTAGEIVEGNMTLEIELEAP